MHVEFLGSHRGAPFSPKNWMNAPLVEPCSRLSVVETSDAIPIFPEWATISPAHKAPIARLTQGFRPFGDFSYVSLFCFDDGLPSLSRLHENIILRLHDIASGDCRRYTTLLGEKRIDDTIDEVLAFEATLPEAERAPIRAVPEEVVRSSRRHRFEPERERFEYAYDIKSWLESDVPSLVRRRERAKRFIRQHPSVRCVRLDLTRRSFTNRVGALVTDVMLQKGVLDRSLLSELRAVERCLAHVSHLDCVVYGCVIGEMLLGMNVVEPMHDGWYHHHFEKSDRRFPGLMEFMNIQVAGHLLEHGFRYCNHHEDLGIGGLRRVKESWAPMAFLKRFRHVCPS